MSPSCPRARPSLVLILLAALAALAALIGIPAQAAPAAEPSRSTGPVFEAFGPVLDDVVADYFPPDDEHRVVWDVWIGPEEKDVVNRRIETLARYMNMNARAGVAVEDMRLAVVLHGTAGKAVLSDAAYRQRFGVDNPDKPLIEALARRGVRFLMCGQSAAARGYGRAEMVPQIDVAVSAYTALLGLQQEGYVLMPSWER